MSSTDATHDPVPLAAALDVLLGSGILAPKEEFIPEPVDYLDDLLGDWHDSPLRVLERTDALDLTDVVWEVDRVVSLVREIAALARVPCAEVRVMTSPAEVDAEADADRVVLPPGAEDPRPRSAWHHRFGDLCDRRLLDAWRGGIESLRAPGVLESPRTAIGRVLWAYASADSESSVGPRYGAVRRFSVPWILLGYLGLMHRQGARFGDRDWDPDEDTRAEFRIELRIGHLLVEAFRAGLGYLAPSGRDILVAPRPALRLLDTPSEVWDRAAFHHDSGPAIEYADGSGPLFLGGVDLDPWLYHAIVDGALTMRYVRDMPWVEVRMAAYPVLPPRALLDGLDARLLDVGRKGTFLYLIPDMPDHHGPVWYMVMTDPSTGREYGEFVPPEVGEQGSADAAQAAAWGISVEDYLRMTLEG